MNTSVSSKVEVNKEIRIAGMKLPVFITVGAVILLGAYLDVIPDNMMSGFAVAMVLGGLLAWLGNYIPGLKYIGGPAVLCIFIPAILAQTGLFPESGVKIVSNFYNGYGYVDFLIAALISGSLLSMDREILLKAGARFAVPVAAGVISAIVVAGLIGEVIGFGFDKAILNVAIPIMGGGIGAGAMPMSQMFAAHTGEDAAEFMSMIVPAIMVANIFCIFVAAILNGLSKREKQLFKGFSGNGKILRTVELSVQSKEEKSGSAYYTNLAIGLMVSGALYILGYIISKKFVPGVHAYAWTIIAAGIIKIFKIAPTEVEEAAGDWYEFIAAIGIPAVLVGLSFSLINMNQIIEVLTNPAYLILTVVTIVVASIAAGIAGWLVSMYYVEASITAGLCMSDAGGSGDVAVLGASERMSLMPFAQISSRLGGALVLIILSFLLPILM